MLLRSPLTLAETTVRRGEWPTFLGAGGLLLWRGVLLVFALPRGRGPSPLGPRLLLPLPVLPSGVTTKGRWGLGVWGVPVSPPFSQDPSQDGFLSGVCYP